jgi:hypothetical protein
MFRSFPRTRESRSCPGSGSPLQFIPDLIGDGDERGQISIQFHRNMLQRSPDERLVRRSLKSEGGSDIRVYLER